MPMPKRWLNTSCRSSSSIVANPRLVEGLEPAASGRWGPMQIAACCGTGDGRRPDDAGSIPSFAIELDAAAAKFLGREWPPPLVKTAGKSVQLARQFPIFAGIRSNPQLARRPVSGGGSTGPTSASSILHSMRHLQPSVRLGFTSSSACSGFCHPDRFRLPPGRVRRTPCQSPPVWSSNR